ncbi:hypothetical protein RHGRI_005513 [Rhododendron griersonianum]|uniref:Ribosomal protein S7 n=1 Tax=Rhododendron griersonianum TaxID=479676 RepID=A0AAV6LF37_9ERIC|nr:hypothetical protein RHGRI_005513 [Rhododendron griersonianum]
MVPLNTIGNYQRAPHRTGTSKNPKQTKSDVIRNSPYGRARDRIQGEKGVASVASVVLRRATTGTVASDRRVGVEVGVGVDGGEAQRLELSRGERERERMELV